MKKQQGQNVQLLSSPGLNARSTTSITGCVSSVGSGASWSPSPVPPVSEPHPWLGAEELVDILLPLVGGGEGVDPDADKKDNNDPPNDVVRLCGELGGGMAACDNCTDVLRRCELTTAVELNLTPAPPPPHPPLTPDPEEDRDDVISMLPPPTAALLFPNSILLTILSSEEEVSVVKTRVPTRWA